MNEGSSRLGIISRGSPFFLFDMFFAKGEGFMNLIFPLWFALLGGSFVFLDMGPSILFLVSLGEGGGGFIGFIMFEVQCMHLIDQNIT